MSRFIFILLGGERIVTRYEDTARFYKREGRRRRRRRRIGSMGKIENEHKKYKKARQRQGQDCRGTLFGKGAIHFRMLYQFLASPPFLLLVLVFVVVVAPPEKLACLLLLFKHRLPPPILRSILSRFIP